MAVERTLLLEWACTLYWRAAAIGTPRTLNEAQQAAFVSALTERRYGTTSRNDPLPDPRP